MQVSQQWGTDWPEMISLLGNIRAPFPPCNTSPVPYAPVFHSRVRPTRGRNKTTPLSRPPFSTLSVLSPFKSLRRREESIASNENLGALF